LLLGLLILCGIVYACPQKQPAVGTRANEPVEAIEQRLKQVRALYEILQKDEPPAEATQKFREKLAAAEQAFKNQDYARASQLSLELEPWIEEARPFYYERHLKLIREGKAPKSGEAMMDEAMEFLKKATLAREEGEQWMANQFFQAAIEHGEAALLVEQQTPEQTVTLLRITRQMDVVYNASGRQGRGRESRGRVAEHARGVLGGLETQLRDRLEGRTQGYDQSSLARSEGAVQSAAREVNRLHNLYQSIVNEYNRTFPEDEYQAVSFGAVITGWQTNWAAYHKTPAPRTPDPRSPDQDPRELEIKRKLAEHNKIKQGALPADNSGIYLDEVGFTARGRAVVLKCVIQNLRPEPIYRPRVVVTGGLMSEPFDLGYYKLNPLTSSIFQVPILYYNTDYLIQLGGLPAHELLLIFQESPDGPEKKVIKPIGRQQLKGD